MTLLSISVVSEPAPAPARMRVELAAATEMSFEIRIEPGGLKYDKVIADICRVAPAMLQYDEALMELYNNPHGPKPTIQQGWLHAIHDFVLRYRRHLVNVMVPFEQFRGLDEVTG